MKNPLSGLVFVVLLGLGLPLLMSGCGPKLTDPHEMWDRLVAEKGITTVAVVQISQSRRNGYTLTVYAIDSSAREVSYGINSAGEVSEYPDHNWDEWHAKVNFPVDRIDLDVLLARVPSKDDPRPGCDEFRSASLTVLPTGKMASWSGCSNVSYHEGSLLIDGRPVDDQLDPRDPVQVVAMVESYNDVFGVGTLVEWHAGVKDGGETYAVALPFADDPNCLISIFSSGRHGAAPGKNMPCVAPTSVDATIPFDLGRFSPTAASDIMASLKSLDIQVSAIDELIFTGTPDGRLKWDASTTNIGDKYEYYDQMRGVLEPIK